MKTTPFNTGKVLIGCNYQPPRAKHTPSRTEAMLQNSLLKGKFKESKTDWDGVVIVFGCIFCMAIVYAWVWGSY